MSRSDMSDNPHKSPDGQPNPSRPRPLSHVYFSNFDSGCQRNESVRYGRSRSADMDCPLLTNMFLFMSLSDSCDQVLSSSVATIYFNPLAPSYRLTSRHQLPIVSKIESRWKFHLCHRTKNSQIFFGDFFEELNRIRPISCTSVFVTTRSSSQKKRQDLKYLIPASSEKIMKCWNSHLKKVKLVNMKVSYSVNIGHGHFWSILWHHGTVHWALLGVEI